ncbi:MAG: serine protease, partial [Ferruginibacter sp.]
MMEDSLLMDAVERFVKDEMSKEEKIYFEDLRKKNPDLDQAVVEQIFFLNQFTQHNAQRHFLGSLTEVQHKLITEGVITRTEKTEEAKVIQLWKRYKRTIGVAASIAGIVSIFIASLVSAVSTQKATNIKPLVEKLHQQETKTRQMERKINKLEAAVVTAPATILDGEAKFRATGFLVDATNNLIITNAHVVKEALNRLIIENNDGLQFIARAIYIDESKDLAVLEVIDPRFKKLPAVPFAIKRNTSNLGEHVFMLGYPKQEVVYGEGYISAK